VTVDGEVLVAREFAVVTRRDKGKEHSYLLFYEGGVDQAGDAGRAIECQKWIAPRLPILIETGTYPNCKIRSHGNGNTLRMSLMAKGSTPQHRSMSVIGIIANSPGSPALQFSSVRFANGRTGKAANI
jgi:hypothetical protein